MAKDREDSTSASATNLTWTPFDVKNAPRHRLYKVNYALELALNPELAIDHVADIAFSWGNMDHGQLEDEVNRRLHICRCRKLVVKLPDPPPFPSYISRDDWRALVS